MANRLLALYVGVTNDLPRRVYEHKYNLNSKSHTAKYDLHKLVYYEMLDTMEMAIVREKQIKDMNRAEKIQMIARFNPTFRDLYEEIC